MCLGESTTAGQYPPYLEEILNQRHTGIRFSVIDKGAIGTNTSVILAQLESNFHQYHPDMVVAMMGANDWGPHIPYETASTSKITLFLRSLRTYKLTRLLWLHILTKAKETGLYNPAQDKQRSRKTQSCLPGVGLKEAHAEQASSVSAEDSLKKAIELNPKNDRAYVELGHFYRAQSKSSQAEDSFKKAIELNPKNDGAYIGLGWVYRDQGRLSQAEDSFKKAIELNPKNDGAYVRLGRFYRDQGRLSQAEDSFKKAIELNPKNDGAYIGLGWVYRDQGRLSQAEDSFKKAIELNPKNEGAYIELGRSYRGQSKSSQVEGSFKKAIELNPKSDSAYTELGWFYLTQGKFFQAEDSFKKAIELNSGSDSAYAGLGRSYRGQGKSSQAEEALKQAIELNPKNDRAYGTLSLLYEETGKPELAKEHAQKAQGLRLGHYVPLTDNNYRTLKEILDKRGARLVCVQYPMRSIEPLKKIFEVNAEGVIFVDNERIFRDAVKKYGYNAYFTDMFAGDFGHCTDKGNRLLAENIANVILKEAFQSK